MPFLYHPQNHLHVATDLLCLSKLTSQVRSKTSTESKTSKNLIQRAYEALSHPMDAAACQREKTWKNGLLQIVCFLPIFFRKFLQSLSPGVCNVTFLNSRSSVMHLGLEQLYCKLQFVCIMDFEDKMNAGANLSYPQNDVSEGLL